MYLATLITVSDFLQTSLSLYYKG